MKSLGEPMRLARLTVATSAFAASFGLVAVVPVHAEPATLSTAATPAPASTATATAADDPVTHDENPRVPEGAAWTETYFPSADASDVELHADVLRPADLPADAKTPVILSVGPYFAQKARSGRRDGTGSDRRRGSRTSSTART
ncbi:MAG: hypothetical protein ACRDOY_13430 [Nocardioidaceae bacterium]